MLEVTGIKVRYGSITALQDVSFRVNEGEIVTLIGANGAGKTTSLHTISGLLPLSGGTISFMGQKLDGRKPEDIVRMGIAHSPEGRRVFSGMSVQENLEIGATPWRRRRDSIDDDLERVYALFPRLAERRAQLAWSMSGGEQQMLAVGRALMGRPKLLLLDEPSLGLAPIIVEQLFDKIVSINKLGVTILLVEQNAAMALSVATRGYLLENGHVVLEDVTERLTAHPLVKEAYLGG
ncbi:MAG: transporter ATP-binding protein [Herbaspirillum sp.]|jgi:branched-chain amino acid transport system ATP-binding protein|nr:transporter ATP-binding protein [Herbaspirillum sp.]